MGLGETATQGLPRIGAIAAEQGFIIILIGANDVVQIGQ